MQTILGAGGAIGVELAKSLKDYTQEIRLVSRHPRAINAGDQLFQADLTDSRKVIEAVKDSEVAYLTVGLPYDIKVWREQWPKIMQNVIEACKKENMRLVFFDNMYMYDPDSLHHMTEGNSFNPVSKKGEVRAKIAEMLLDEIEKGEIEAAIARSADFYGYSTNSSILGELVFKNFAKGKKANWFSSVSYRHSFTYIPDAARATAILGNTRDAFGETWHLPTAADPLTGEEWIEQIAENMNVKPRYQVLSWPLVRFLGIFKNLMKELAEMMYQYDRDYVFDSTKFEKKFSFKPVSYPEGIRKIVEKDFTLTPAKE